LTADTSACACTQLALRAGKKLQYRRIDGGSSLADRETAIQDFNAPNSPVFIFLLSIRAAGRGLNLQTSDTVVMYDPDANPKNEEQARAFCFCNVCALYWS
jgi:SWI/SNF-related matrix-associated actin-dependent regulator of chromatin subfamily A member 2/4